MTASQSRAVVFVWRRIPPPFLIGGAEVSQQLLAEGFAAAGWRTIYLASHEPPWTQTTELPCMLSRLTRAGIACDHRESTAELHYSWNGVEVRAVPQTRIAAALDAALDELAPALVITSQEGSADLSTAARPRTTVAGWLHSISATGMHVLDGNPHYALATSRFVLSHTPLSQAAVLFYPPFKIPATSPGTRTSDLLMVNPVPAKGADLIHQLADQLPERHLTLVEGWWDTSADFARHPNVTYLPRTYDMNGLYTRHQLLLVPSTVPDAFPRVITEAALNGLPALGSTRGGIPEAIGDPALLAPADDVAAWASRIRALHPGRLTQLGDQARHRATALTRACLPELAAAGLIPA